MYRDAGWVRVSSDDGAEVLGRGHLYLRDAPAYGGQQRWNGSLDSIRLERGVEPLTTGYYLLHLESGPDVLTVRLDRHRLAEPGVYSAAVESAADHARPLPMEEEAAS